MTSIAIIPSWYRDLLRAPLSAFALIRAADLDLRDSWFLRDRLSLSPSSRLPLVS